MWELESLSVFHDRQCGTLIAQVAGIDHHGSDILGKKGVFSCSLAWRVEVTATEGNFWWYYFINAVSCFFKDFFLYASMLLFVNPYDNKTVCGFMWIYILQPFLNTIQMTFSESKSGDGAPTNCCLTRKSYSRSPPLKWHIVIFTLLCPQTKIEC